MPTGQIIQANKNSHYYAVHYDEFVIYKSQQAAIQYLVRFKN